MRLPKKRLVVIVIVAVCVALACTYGIGVWYFQTHYYPGMVVGGQDAAHKTEDELARSIDKSAQEYVLTLHTGDFELVIDGSQVDLRTNGKSLAHAARQAMDETLWPLQVIGGVDTADEGVSFNVAKLEHAVNEAVDAYNKDATAPKDAYLELNDQASAFVCVPEEPGTALDATMVCRAAVDSLQRLVGDVDLGEHANMQPRIKQTDQATQEALTRANNALYHNVDVEYDGLPVRTLGYDQWVEYLGVDKDLNLTLDEEAFGAWADVWLWQTVDHADKKNAYILDSSKLAQDLLGALGTRSVLPVELPTKAVPRYLDKSGELPKASWDSSEGRYVEVNIGKQYARLFGSDGVVAWETVVTTGNVNSGNGTPTGTYYIYDKKTDFTLLGEDQNDDGKYDYERHVDFWMPFNEGIGLHDASWRKKYGSDYYLTKGSGGCVNLPHDAAEALFEMIHVGDKVIVHD